MLNESSSFDAVLAHSQNSIQAGSKSFALASRLFRSDERNAAAVLYGWCRYCDDQIDESAKTEDEAALWKRWEQLREQTEAAVSQRRVNHPVFFGLSHIVRRYEIPREYALELIEGLAMDIRSTPYYEISDLIQYCYRVAGTVGLMMTHVMGVSKERALRHACDLGIAMQLTNISRDVGDDARLGRIYLPLNWFERPITTMEVLAGNRRAEIARVVSRLLKVAEQYYRSADQGLRYLRFREAWAVGAAREVYSEIGKIVIARGERAWEERSGTTKVRKLFLVGKALGKLIFSVPYRLSAPWHRHPLTMVWRHE